MKKFINWLKSEESGQGMVEYALIIALLAVVLIGALTALSGGIGDIFDKIKTELGNAEAGATPGGGTPPAGGGETPPETPTCEHTSYNNGHCTACLELQAGASHYTNNCDGICDYPGCTGSAKKLISGGNYCGTCSKGTGSLGDAFWDTHYKNN